MTNTKEHFIDLLSNFSVGMLTTISEDGHLHSRPMAIADVSDNGDVFLVTARDTAKVSEIALNDSVSLSCQDNKGSHVTLSGTASLRDDPKKIQSLWKSEFDSWFPGGSANALLIRLEPFKGEYWDVSGLAKAKHMYEIVRSKITQEDPHLETQHGSVDLLKDSHKSI